MLTRKQVTYKMESERVTKASSSSPPDGSVMRREQVKFRAPQVSGLLAQALLGRSSDRSELLGILLKQLEAAGV